MFRGALALTLVLACVGCATRKQTGQALVVAGTTAVIVGATGGAAYCAEDGCVSASPAQNKHSAVIAGAGLATVVAGTMLEESDRYDTVSPARRGQQSGDPVVVPATYRLPRRDPATPATATPATEAPATETPASESPASESPGDEAAPTETPE